MKVKEYIRFIKTADVANLSGATNSVNLNAPEMLSNVSGIDIPKSIDIPNTIDMSFPYTFSGNKQIPFTEYKTPDISLSSKQYTIPIPKIDVPSQTTIHVPSEFNIGNSKVKLPQSINVSGTKYSIPSTININGTDINLPSELKVNLPHISSTEKPLTTQPEIPDFSSYTPGYGLFNPLEGRDLFRVITDIPTLYAFQKRTDPRGAYANLRGTAYTKPKDPLNSAINWTNFAIAIPPFVGASGEFPTMAGKGYMFPLFEEMARPNYSIGALMRPGLEQLATQNIIQKHPDSLHFNNLFTLKQKEDIKKLNNLLRQVGLLNSPSSETLSDNINDSAADVIDSLNAAYTFNPQINGAFYDWLTTGKSDDFSIVQGARYAPESLEVLWSLMRPGTGAAALKALGGGTVAAPYAAAIIQKELAAWNDFYRQRANLSDMGWKWDTVTASPFLESQDGSTIYYTPATYRMTGFESYPKGYHPAFIRDPIERSKRNVYSNRTGVLLSDGSYVKAYTPFLNFEGNALTPFTEKDPRYFAAVRPMYTNDSKYMVMRDLQGNTYPATRPDEYPITAAHDSAQRMVRPFTEAMGWTGNYTTESEAIDLDGRRIKEGNQYREAIVNNPQWQAGVRLALENPDYLDPYIETVDTIANTIKKQGVSDTDGSLEYLNKIKGSLIQLKSRLLQSYIPPEFVPGQDKLVEQYFEALNSKNWYKMSVLRDEILELRNKGRKAYLQSLGIKQPSMETNDSQEPAEPVQQSNIPLLPSVNTIMNPTSQDAYDYYDSMGEW